MIVLFGILIFPIIILIVGFVIAIIVASDAKQMSEKLKKENQKLKQKIAELEEQLSNLVGSSNTMVANDQYVETPVQNTVTAQEAYNGPSAEELAQIEAEKQRVAIENLRKAEEDARLAEIKAKEEKARKDELNRRRIKLEQDRKNTGILVVGAILIILAAVVFLMSTWNYTHNALKTIIMALVVVLFLKLSEIADKKHGLKKASKAFFYIAMAYIPICLISFCVFGLLGEYFSINGEGKYMYLSFSFILTSIIYYINYKSLKTKELFVGTILSQILSIVLILAIFDRVSYITFLTAILIYNLLLKISKFVKNELKISNYITNGIVYVSVAIVTLSYADYNTLKVIPYILLILNIVYGKLKKDVDIFLINFIMYEFGYYLIFKGFNNFFTGTNLIIAIFYSIAIFTIQSILLNEKKCSIPSFFEIGSFIILVILSLFCEESPNAVYIILSILLAYNIILKFISSSREKANLLDVICQIIEYISIIAISILFFNKNNFKVIPLILLIVTLFYKKQRSNADMILTNLSAYELGYYVIFIMLNSIPQTAAYIVGIIYTIAIFTAQYLIINKEDCIIPLVFEIGSIIVLLISGLSVGIVNLPYYMITILLLYCMIVQYFNNQKDDNLLRILCRAIEFISIFLITIKFYEKANIKIVPMILVISNLMYNNKRYNLDLFLVNIMTSEFGYYLLFIAMDSLLLEQKIIIGIIYTLIIFILHYMLIDGRYFGIPAYFGMANILFLFIVGRGSTSVVHAYVFLLVELLMMGSCLRKNKEYWEPILSVLMPITTIAFICNIIYVHLNLDYMYLIAAIIIFVLSERIKINSKYFNNTLPIISNMFLTGTFLYVCSEKTMEVYLKIFYSISVILVYGYNYLKFENDKNIPELLLCYAAGIPLICLEMINPIFKDIIYLIFTILITYKSIIRKKVSLETIISATYLLFTVLSVQSIYLRYILGIIWVYSNTLFEEKKQIKDILFIIMYVLMFLLYNTVLTDLGISETYNSFMLLGLVVLLMAISRLETIKDIKDFETLEAIVAAAIYLLAIPNYRSEQDGMIFVVGIVGIIFVSYKLRYGSIFLFSLIAVVVNAILLTRAFWLVVPWWIYLLIIGSVLIAFATKNESDANKLKNTNPKDIVKKIIEKIENHQ